MNTQETAQVKKGTFETSFVGKLPQNELALLRTEITSSFSKTGQSKLLELYSESPFQTFTMTGESSKVVTQYDDRSVSYYIKTLEGIKVKVNGSSLNICNDIAANVKIYCELKFTKINTEAENYLKLLVYAVENPNVPGEMGFISFDTVSITPLQKIVAAPKKAK